MPLTPEQIDEILKSQRQPRKTPQEKLQAYQRKHFIRISTHFPVVRNNKHYKRIDVSRRCVSRGCGAPSYELIDGIPYCGSHAIFALVVIIDRLERQLNAVNGVNAT